tara:strand:+ start:1767 stop:2345 length:579 start_codon:yes stop_codon:yes gene_type:complete
MCVLSNAAITKSYLKDLKTEVKNRRRSKVLRKKVLKELKKMTPTVKPVKTNVKSKQALKKIQERAEAKELANMFRDSERLAQKLIAAKTKDAEKALKAKAKAAEKAAKKLAATQAKAAEKALKAKAMEAKKAAKKLAATQAKFAKKALALLKFAQANNYTIEDIVAELKSQVEPSRSDNFVTIIDSENNINM